MKLGIVGLPNVGKSTLFNSLTKAGALSANYPFATIDPNVGIVSVPDERIVKLGELYHTKKVTPATIEFVDIAGLVKGASKGEGLGNQFLANIREVDAIVHVVRCFEDTNIIHVDGSIDPARDIETINLELIFSDIEILERRIAKSSRGARNDKKLAKEVGFYCFQQFCFFKQWTALKAYANAKGVEMIGDIPIYVAFDSADAWAQPELFQFDKENIPIGVAGCPPDAFSATGQLWGNPLYDWEYHKKTGYAWWTRRMANCMKLYDVVRIDHFRGFDEYYSIPYGDKTAEFGHWEKGPGMDLFRALEKNLGKLDVIAEDLGLLTDSVIEMVEESGFPGMKVLQFAFDENEDSPYLTHRYERNCIVYTGTHDNETTRGWFRNLRQHDRNFARAYIGCEGKHETAAVWSMIRAAMSSVADRCVIPVQDYLCLGNEARINEPSTLGDNWKWRMKKGQLNETIIQKIYKMTKLYGRLVKEETEEKEKTEADREKISDK